MKFTFRYDSVLRIEKQFEKIAEVKVQAKFTALRNQVEVRNTLEKQINEMEVLTLEALRVNPQSVMSRHDADARLREQLVKQTQIIDQHRQELQHAIVDRNERSKRVEAFESIKERDLEQHLENEARVENEIQLDLLLRPRPNQIN